MAAKYKPSAKLWGAEVQIETFAELLSVINGLEAIGAHYFRGYREDKELISTLGRESCDGLSALKDFAAELYSRGFPEQTFRQLLALAQHYGIPTNLIDLTTDPWVAVFFGLGRKKTGQFHILYENKEQFDGLHSEKVREYKITLWDIDDVMLADLDPLEIEQLCGLSENTKMSAEYVESFIFDRLYEKFYDSQIEYTLVPYEKNYAREFNLRIEKQKGLFVLAKNECVPIPVAWFKKVDVNLQPEEFEKLSSFLAEKGYLGSELLPSSVEGVDIKELAEQIKERYLIK